MSLVEQYLREMGDYFVSTGEITKEQSMLVSELPKAYSAFAFEDRALILVRGCEVHLFVRETWRKHAISRRTALAVLSPIFERYGYATTVLSIDDSPVRVDFVKRLGFSPTWNDGERQYYMLTKLPFDRSKS